MDRHGPQPNYFRKPGDRGWALIGDAEIHHDSVNPSGITYALVNSEKLVDAIHKGLTGAKPLEDALDEYEVWHHARWSAHFDFLVHGADLGPPTPEA